MNIRFKLTALPIIAILLPLFGGIFYVRQAVRSFYEHQVGILYLTIAKDMVDGLERDVRGQIENLDGWVRFRGLADQMADWDETPFDQEVVQDLDEKWSALGVNDEPLRTILSNPQALALSQYQKVNPLFVELLLTDALGRLVAASNPTTDYWQGDEDWWTQAAGRTTDEWSRNIMYDASAGVQTMDIVLPIRSDDGTLLGVLKGSLNAIEILRHLEPDPWNAEISRDILFRDGHLFARLNNPADDVSLPERIDEEGLVQLSRALNNWAVLELFPGNASLCAVVPVAMAGDAPADDLYETIYVLVHRDEEAALAPVNKVIQSLTRQASVVVVAIAILSFMLSTAWFARPLAKLYNAAVEMANHVRRREQGNASDAHRSMQDVQHALKRLDSIQTKDEMEELAGMFSHMGNKVLKFHQQLELELARKTEEINEDLVMAREFQEALLPDEYPRIPAPGDGGVINLAFSHIYRPAQSVSGDFFDISEVSKHSVRVVVADVMGHGARSALMTAILHALISDTAKSDGDPAHLLQRMNEEFHAIGQRTGDMVFVTAIHMLINTRERVIRYATAGHPSPLLVDAATGNVEPLIPEGLNTPAAGLFADTKYEGSECGIEKAQSILLYTDGVIEAQNPHDEEFGTSRLIQAVTNCFKQGQAETLPKYVLEELEAFMDTRLASDDICLVAVGISKTEKK